jgi:uncharacterized protein with PIN domain
MHAQEIREIDNALVGFAVVDRAGEPVGEAADTSLDRNCLIVTTGRKLVGRAKRYPVHRSAIEDVDVDAMTVTIRATRAQVEQAPGFRDLDERCAEEVERYYAGLGGA